MKNADKQVRFRGCRCNMVNTVRAKPKVAAVGSSPPRSSETVSEPAWAVSAAYERPLTVLIVEDEEFLRVPVAKLLRRRGFAVVETADGRAAMDLFAERSGEIDVVFL